MSSNTITPGLLVLHGNRAELLGDAVFEWLRRQPLQPLEEEIFLVQSNGVAEWLKMTLATQSGICAATRVELPGRFLWRAYRQLLGRGAVPSQSPLDKLPLTWRLMQALPELMERPGFEPLAGFLNRGDMARRLQLAEALADLFDQYQVYRSDWLDVWGLGHDRLPKVAAEAWASSPVVPPDQLWQPALWREMLGPLTPSERASTRPQLHQRFMTALAAGAEPVAPLARRVVLFGMTHVPMQTLEALAALSERCQVVLAIPNPCRYHWADIIDGRELLKMSRRRQPLRNEVDLAALGLEAMHAHAHPLLASWGRQGRDFVRQLDAFDDALQAQQRFALAKIDLFDDGPGETLLQQVQSLIRDLTPLAEHPATALDAGDRSIVFHIAHGAQREVEILHDQLLALLAQPALEGGAGAALAPRDIVVMVPDIDQFAPSIRSVFGQYPRQDARFIPYDIADLKERGHNPLLIALEWLLRLPQQRCRLSEVRDLLDVPAVAERFGLQAQDLPRLSQWMDGAGIRWGLNLAQRADLGLAACGEQNSWLFGLRRILLGYATGAGAEFDGVQPYPEVGGLDAALAGSLADLVQALQRWWQLAAIPALPAEWAERGRELLAAFFTATTEQERNTLAVLQAALGSWLEACELADFTVAVELPIAREAWLTGVDLPTLNRRFKAGGVTFCTLMPMRAVPFEVVCLLGMNDGDYPRRGSRNDFDLMGLPGQQRPGDRSRRLDDRQLMLEALLSARRQLYLSWSGRSVRDNSEQPPSVLVSQLRDYLTAGWGATALAPRTTEHPLQPFSRRYFELDQPGQTAQFAGAGLFTHAREWRVAHLEPAESAAATAVVPFDGNPDVPLTVAALAGFLKNPVKEFFRQRLDVVFRDDDAAAEDEEAFAIGGLLEYGMLAEVSDAVLLALDEAQPAADLPALVAEQAARIRRAGRLPVAELGRRAERLLADSLVPMLEQWRELQSLFPLTAAKAPLRFAQQGLQLDDWLDGLQTTPQAEQLVWLELSPSRVCSDPKKLLPRADRLLTAWVRMLAASACGEAVLGLLVGRDATVKINPLPQDEAQRLLADLMQAWLEGMTEPLPFAAKTALAQVMDESKAAIAYDGASFTPGGYDRPGGEVEEASLARLFPDFAALSADGRFAAYAERLYGPINDWIQRCVTLELHPPAALNLPLNLQSQEDSAHV